MGIFIVSISLDYQPRLKSFLIPLAQPSMAPNFTYKDCIASHRASLMNDDAMWDRLLKTLIPTCQLLDESIMVSVMVGTLTL